ncbi:hypothetical protein OH146_07595 [Salinibacterium sp. SYSU T00001]|uniref:hypothetical protein n=1 Tax=Homoserinimonas sedimenticola TaxID=2986805 RepID=UPI002236B591|nr:hypothetical protein [Salinibacterium sedimenticola]MCW4385636.1 hypothetical protein [Salinibacterium sedimenticola]
MLSIAAGIAVLAVPLLPSLFFTQVFDRQEARIEEQAHAALIADVERHRQRFSDAVADNDALGLQASALKSFGPSIFESPSGSGQYAIVVDGEVLTVDVFTTAVGAGNPTFSNAMRLYACVRISGSMGADPAVQGVQCPQEVLEKIELTQWYDPAIYDEIRANH